LVDQDNAPVAIPAEFEFGVGDDDAMAPAGVLAERIDGAGHALQRIGYFIADDLAHPLDRDVLVMAGFGLGRRAENWRLEFGAFDEARRQSLTCERALRGIFLPRRAGKIAADHAFDRKHRGGP